MKNNPNQKPYRLIDMYAGAGGFSLGFSKVEDELGNAGFESVWANDFNKAAVETYCTNFGDHCVFGDIEEILSDPRTVIPEADIVIGGPPCQGFSLLNKNREFDTRKQLWMPFMEVVERSGATVFVMENVSQLLKSFEYEEIVKHAEGLGFFVAQGRKLCAADYGVPQMRYRAIIVGAKKINPSKYFPPKATHAKSPINIEGLPAWRTVRDAISDLPCPVGIEIRTDEPPLDLHFGRTPTEKSLARYQVVSEEGMNRFDLQRLAPELTPDCWIRKKSGGTDLFGRLWWDKPALTIRTEFFKPEKGRYLHPEQHRPITHREAARIQSFPDDFVFKGSKIEIARQIGNAVPPRLAFHIAQSVFEMMVARDKRESIILEKVG